MANDKFKDEMLTDDELDGVVGGSNREYSQIYNAISTNSAINGGETYKYYNVDAIKTVLKEKLGIDAEINTDFSSNRLDLGNVANKYTRNGESLTQAEVLKLIKAYK